MTVNGNKQTNNIGRILLLTTYVIFHALQPLISKTGFGGILFWIKMLRLDFELLFCLKRFACCCVPDTQVEKLAENMKKKTNVFSIRVVLATDVGLHCRGL